MPSLKTFPTLYKKTSTGAQQEWTISVDGNEIITAYGQTGGKIQTAHDVVREGKNIGRANATTPAQQALAEAKSQWDKKLKKGYVLDPDKAMAGEVSEVIEGGFFPMLAKKYDEDGDKIVFPCYVQPKFDGHRCGAVVVNGDASLWSRTRKPITGVPHIAGAIERLVGGTINLDGELYNHAYRAKFEELSSFIRQVTPKPGYEVVQYHVYDIADPELTFEQRLKKLEQLLGTHDEPRSEILVPVCTMLVNNEEELMLAFEYFLEQGYEGAMVRNAKGKYVFKRSADLQKIKEFDDAEFEIIGIEEGRGKLAGHGIFNCKTADGIEFAAKMKGETEKLRDFYVNPQKYIGRMLTVKFQGMTKYGKPRFPVALRLQEAL